MKITFIKHSGFAVEMDQCIFVFDHWQDPAHVVPPLFEKGKPVYFFVSHFHGDHYSRDIFTYKERAAQYILHKDCDARGIAAPIHYMDVGEDYETPHFSVHMYGSTDAGGSYMIRAEGKTIFHGGDLNWWHWAGEPDADNRHARAWYEKELAAISEKTVDYAFFPVDARQAVAREWGVKAFLRQVRVKKCLIAMHAFGIRWCPSYEFRWNYEGTPLWIPQQEGDSFES